MKTLITLLLVCLTSYTIANEMYSVHLKRLDQDVYKDTNTGTIIVTEHCYKYTYGDDAIIIWEGEYSYNNRIVFDDGDICKLKHK